jgi:protoheme IX farnesyltransferase
MTDLSAVEENRRTTAFAVSEASVGDYFALMKPRVMSLVVFTALVGLMIAPGHLHPVLGFAALLCIAVGAGAAGALNMWFDADVDAMMSRTRSRPIPAGRVLPQEALGFGMTLAVGSVAVLGLVANWLAAGLLAFTIFFYVAIYTAWLKRSTPQNIVIGGAAGAFPPMIGWAAATGAIGIESVLMFLIIFFWTPPHFWALSLWRSQDYARAGIPMLPVVAGAAETRRQILIYSLALAPIGAAPWLAGEAGLTYGATALVAGGMLARLAHQLYRLGDTAAGDRAAKKLFGFSIVYLFLLFAVLLIDDRLGAPGRILVSERRDVAMDDDREDGIILTEEQKRRRRHRSIAIALVLGALVALFYIVTIVKLGPGVVHRPL